MDEKKYSRKQMQMRSGFVLRTPRVGSENQLFEKDSINSVSNGDKSAEIAGVNVL